MVAYSFKPQFEAPIVERIKPHTLRGPRPRHARPGEHVQHYVGMRTRSCRLIATALCDRLQAATLNFGAGVPIVLHAVEHPARGVFDKVGPAQRVEAVEAFAISDGFEGWEAMARFWRDTHRVTAWEGFLIGWDVRTLELPPVRSVIGAAA